MGSLVGLVSALFAYHGWGMDWNNGGWFWMALMMIGGGILIVVVIYLLFRPFYGHRPGSSSGAESALDVAKRRYAAGEITAEKFENIKRASGGRVADVNQ
jgi:uncharacterized membrane protein